MLTQIRTAAESESIRRTPRKQSEANPILPALSCNSLWSRYLDNPIGSPLRAVRHVCVAQLLQAIRRPESR